MFERYIDFLDDESQKLKDFLALLDSYLKTHGENASIKNQLICLSTEELSHIFNIAKFNPKLQIDIWRVLPDELVDNPESSRIFEAVLDNKFGEHLGDIDRHALVQILNSSRAPSRSHGQYWQNIIHKRWLIGADEFFVI